LLTIEQLPKNLFLIRLLDQLKTSHKSDEDQKEKAESSKENPNINREEQFSSQKPLAKAIYDFNINPTNNQKCLSFTKGTIILIQRRIDQNWAEGNVGEMIGIFPLSYVNLNPMALSLMQNYTMQYKIPNLNNVTSDSSILNTCIRAPFQQLRPTHTIATAHTSNAQFLNLKSLRSKPELSTNDIKNNEFVALHNYSPQKADELELKKGEHYIVQEVCKDGWFKGSNLDKTKKGKYV
jgi:SH3 domain/Variant SH3 domain